MSAVDTIVRSSQSLPDIRAVHWLPRIVLASVIAYQGIIKFPLAADDAVSAGVPYILWFLTAVGEVAAAVALIAGGFLRSWVGDVLTRAGGLVIALITLAVIVVVYWAPPLYIFLGNQLHLLMIVGGLYFAARGNQA
ncbi:MAG: hypothetical protein AAFZ04_10375 [Pseudomonadota bacterium]